MGAILQSTQFAALEPSWHVNYRASELRGLLTLAALFNERVYINDTQLLDNPHVFQAYVFRRDRTTNLYRLLLDLVRLDIVRIALRDEMFIARSDVTHRCDSLSEVHEAWKRQELEDAWVIPPESDDRLSFVEELEREIAGEGFLRYPYVDIKRQFMLRVRRAAEDPPPTHKRYYERLDRGVRRRYSEILSREWFSHSDVYSLLRQARLSERHPFIQLHGLLDEECYATWHEIRLIGSGTSRWDSASDLLGKQERPPQSSSSVSEPDLSIDAPGLTLIGTLSATEIVELREQASGLFRMQELRVNELSEDELVRLSNNYAEAVLGYWDRICSHLRKTRRELAQQRTRIGVFTRDHLPTFSRLGQRYSSLLLDVGLDILQLLPGDTSVSDATRERLHDRLSLRFIMFGDDEAMSALQKAIPARSWLTERYIKSS